MALVHVDFEKFKQSHVDICRQYRESNSLIKLDYPSDELHMYVVPSHPGVNEVLKNEQGHMVHFADYFLSIENKSPADEKIGEIFSKNLGNNSPQHVELRKAIRNHFNGAAVDQHVDFIQACVDDLITRLPAEAEANGGVVDIIKHFAMPLTFLVTSHMIGLEFESEDEKKQCIEQAGEAIRLVNLIADESDKQSALKAHDELSDFILPQLEKFCAANEGDVRKDCLFFDFAEAIKAGENDKLDSFIELVNGLFQAGLGATGSFIALTLHLLLEGNDDNKPEDIQRYYLSPERTDEEKREAINEYIRVIQGQLGGMFPRYTKQGGPLMGETLEPNSLIYMSFSSANLDSAAFVEPAKVNAERAKISASLSKDELREHRNKRKEKALSFSYGEHMCPGKRIALTIIRYALDQLFASFPDMSVEGMEAINELFGKPSEVVSLDLRLNA